MNTHKTARLVAPFVSSLAALALGLCLVACCSAPAQPQPTPPDTTPPDATPPRHTTPDEPGPMCGGIAGIQCEPGSFCDFEERCGAADVGGHCMKTPQVCTREFRPVCGCDGKTYGNACTAHAAQTSILHTGECAPPPVDGPTPPPTPPVTPTGGP